MERKGCKRSMERGSYEVLLWIGLFASRLLGSSTKLKKVGSMHCWSSCLPAGLKLWTISVGHKSLWIPSDAWTGYVYDSVRYRDVSSLVHLLFGQFSSFLLSFSLSNSPLLCDFGFISWPQMGFFFFLGVTCPSGDIKRQAPRQRNDLICKAHLPLWCHQLKINFHKYETCERSNI